MTIPDLTPDYAEAVAARLERIGWQPQGERDEGAALIRAMAKALWGGAELEQTKRTASAAEAVAGLLTLAPEQSEAVMDAVDELRRIAAENARLRALIAAHDAWAAGVPSQPPVSQPADMATTHAEAIRRAYMLGTGDAASAASSVFEQLVQFRDYAAGGAADAETAIRALTPPADLADRVKGTTNEP